MAPLAVLLPPQILQVTTAGRMACSPHQLEAGTVWRGYQPLAHLLGDRAVSDFDVRHNAAVNFTWEVPSPTALTGISRVLLHGWQLGAIFVAQSGSPFSVRINSDQARSGTSLAGVRGGPEKPDYVAAPGCSTNAINPGNFTNYLKTECFAFPALGSLGNLGRNTLRGPGLANVDFSLFKSTAVSEVEKWQPPSEEQTSGEGR